MDGTEALAGIKKAWIAGIVSGSITLIVTAAAMAGFPLMGFTAWNMLDVLLIAGLTFGVYRKSRTCALLLFAYFIGSKIMIWTESKSASGIPMALVIGYCFFEGIRGTFAWHELQRGAAKPAQRAAEGPVPQFKSREEYLAWKEHRSPQAAATAAAAPEPMVMETAPAQASSTGAIVGVVLLVAVIGLAGLFMTVGSGTGPQAAAWQEFSSAEGQFSIILPGSPSHETKNTDTAAGAIAMHIFSVEPARSSAYMIIYSDYPDFVTKVPADAVLNGGRDGALADSKGTLLAEKELSLDGHPGRELLIEIPGKGMLKARFFLVRQRLYQVLTAGTKETVEHEDTTKFLTSFRLLPR